uniref:REX1, RNA exonuclease 1 homolog n=1 Tax=Acanthochromis polyacanthus TaxID=80966 RepID=A0A3Q1F0I7_9TELE
MLRSTGFFRGIDCPFYTDYSEGKGGRHGCNRPYCHFRHSQQRRSSYGAPADVKKQRELLPTHKEQGYDPFNPEVVRPQEQQNGKPADSGDLSGALELVNKAIEEVRSEVEREQRKLSRIEDEPYNPSKSTSSSSADTGKSKATGSHLAYDPGSYQITSGGYNPTPGCSKYTLDLDNQGHSSNSMEYVPTSVKKPASRTHSHQPPSPPPSPKYSNSLSSSKCKYTVDNSRPSTDMEYDPLSNYSAGIAAKSKKEEASRPVRTEGSKAHKILGSDLSDEGYVVAVKKPRQQPVDIKKYTFSDSDEESSGTEYRPTSLSVLQQRKGNNGSAADASGKERKERTESVLSALTQRNKNELTKDSDTHENNKRKNNLEKKKTVSGSSHEKSGKTNKVNRLEKELNKSSSSKSSSSSKDKGSVKSSNQDSAKKENKSHGKQDDRKSMVKTKTSEKVQREGRDDKRSDGKIKTVEKVKTDSSKRDKDTENSARESKKPKTSDKEKEHSKHKDRQHKNGKLDSSKREKDMNKVSKSSSSSSKGIAAHSKEKVKQNINSSNGKRLEDKRQSLSLSHADLFGDESPDEAEPMEVDYDDEVEEVLVRKSADALRRGHMNKRKASELTPSSSEDENDHDVESSRTGRDEVDDVKIDFSSFQDDLDFDSDPMEECLRIFNESKDVKREDKGRQTKQPSRDSEEEKCTESTLTTLFPGQKKRVSHFVAKGSTDAPPKSVVRPYRRPTAQEVCYQRMQMARQQAAQLSASVKAASQSSSLSFSGEKKRIAHRPNPQMSSSKTSPTDAKPAACRVLSPSQTHPSVKAQTTAGILSKTSSTTTQKRVAHTPTMKSSSMKRPVIPTDFGAKVPTNIRQRYLNTFIDECVKFCPSEDAAFQMALDEEKLVYERSNSKNIYLNVAVNTLKKLRSKSNSCPSLVTKHRGLVAKRRSQSHEEVLGGRLAATTSFTVNRMGKQQEEKLTGTSLYRKLKAYLMTEEQLQEHGYPRTNPEAAGKAIIYNLPEKKNITDPFTKICCRCGTEYKINVNGNCVRKEECSFHWGRLRRQKVAGGWETSYSCCAAAVGAPGCQMAKQHVQDGRKESLDGYVSTFSKPLSPDRHGGVFALDCEMCYTKQGLELTRVTVIDSEMKVIYDTFVKPESKVVDYNTRFSGVTEEDLESATITLRDVQAVLLSMFSAESILIGHSLDSDLLALKLIHSSVVDTAIVFPHRLGLPYKRALKNLMADHLKRIIQDNVEGHDSSEDASACMELMIWKIKEDAKVKR